MWLCCFQCAWACVCVCACVCVRTASCSSLCPEVCFPPLLALLSTDQKESSLVWFLEQSAPPPTLSFLPASLQSAKERVKEGRWSTLLWGKKEGGVVWSRHQSVVSAEVYVRRGIGRGDLPSSGRLWSWCNFDELLKAQVLRRRPARGRVCTCELDTWLCFWFWEIGLMSNVLRHTKLWCSVRVFKFYSNTHYFSIQFLSCYQMHQHHIMWVSCLQCRSSYF